MTADPLPSDEDLYGGPLPTPAAADAPPALPPAEGAGPRPPARGPAAWRAAAVAAFVGGPLAGLANANDIKVWLVMCRAARPGGVVRTSQAAIARRAGAAVRTVARALGRLRAAGLVRVVRQGGFPKRVTVYRVVPAPRPGKARRGRQGEPVAAPRPA